MMQTAFTRNWVFTSGCIRLKLLQQKDRIRIISAGESPDELNKDHPVARIALRGFVALSDRTVGHHLPEFQELHGVENMEGQSLGQPLPTLEVLDNLGRVSDDLWLRLGPCCTTSASLTKRFQQGPQVDLSRT